MEATIVVLNRNAVRSDVVINRRLGYCRGRKDKALAMGKASETVLGGNLTEFDRISDASQPVMLGQI